MIYMLLVMVAMFAVLPFSTTIGAYANYLLYPLIGFNGSYPILTILCGGVVLVIFQTIIAHITTDWRAQAKAQQISRAFQQEFRKAQIEKNAKKLNELRKKQQDMMSLSMEQSSKQMRLMPVTFIIAMFIFFWLYYFLGTLENTIVQAPWGSFDLLATSMLFPNYVWFYMLITFPLGHVLRKGLQLVRLNREHNNAE
jgi:uncharacterized membrane protein (DUF106 family)